MVKELTKELLSEGIKKRLSSNLVTKLHSYLENRMQWLYYGALINQEQSELGLLNIKACQGYCTLHDILSSDKHKKTLSEYQNEQFKYFRSMCCDALDICNELFSKS